MSQVNPVKKATLKAYLTSGAIVVLSLLFFFYFHKQQDDETEQRIVQLETLLAQANQEIQALKSAPTRATSESETKPESKPDSKPVVPPQMTLIEPTAPKSEAPGTDKPEAAVFITRTESTYHRIGCEYLNRSQNPISKKDAIAQGYSACSKCNP
jgi:hypothetical protein